MLRANSTLTTTDYWASIWNSENAPHGFMYINELLSYLPRQEKLDFLEIGCGPGGILADFCLTNGYTAYGVDNAIDVKKVKLYLEKMNVNIGEIYNSNFLDWNPERQYNIVSSFGFIEHFTNPSFILDRHFDLTLPNGLVIVGVPNFARGQKLLHFLFDRDHLRIHNTTCMNLKFFYSAEGRNSSKLLFANYVGGHFEFWSAVKKHNNKYIQYVESITLKIVTKLVRYIPAKTNSLFSPYIIAIFQKEK